MSMICVLGNFNLDAFVPVTFRTSTWFMLQTTILVGVLYAVYKIISFIRYRIQTEKIFGNLPGPKERNFLYGSFLVMKNLDSQERLLKFIEWGNTYSKERGYIRLWGTMGIPFVFPCHPSSMKRILRTAEPKAMNLTSGYRTLKPWLGDGLLISGGDKWARNRRILTPAFHFDILKPYIDVYNDSANVLIVYMILELYIAIFLFFILFKSRESWADLLTRRRNLKYFSRETHPYVQAVNDLAACNAERLRNPLLAPDIIFYRTKMGKKFKQDCDYVHKVAEDIINTRRRTLEELDDIKRRKYLDFLDILLTAKDENGVGLSDMDIRNEVDTFLFEGHDTTASAISWILYSLAKHPEYQEKCQKEIDDLLQGRESDDIKWNDLPTLEYLTMCIKEGMRLHCPVAIVGRTTTKPFDLGDTMIPPGTGIAISIWMLHHNEHVWGKDHMEYKPERFTKSNVAKMDPFQFVPFSGGPRNCIGQNFAMNEEKVVLAKLLISQCQEGLFSLRFLVMFLLVATICLTWFLVPQCPSNTNVQQFQVHSKTRQ